MKPYLTHNGPIAFAHRGGAKLWPENTLLAFRNSVELGFSYIETDVHLTLDGEIVIFHDDTLERTTNGLGPIADRTLKELRRLDAGYRFRVDGGFPFRGQGISIPTLDEALALSPDLRLNLELKPRNTRIAKAMWDYIDHHGIHDRVLVASAHTPTGRAFSRFSRESVATSAGRNEVIAFWAAARTGFTQLLPTRYDALQVPLRVGPLQVVTPTFLAAAHARGLQVHVWTIDEEDRMRELLEIGVDAVMTDRPDVLIRVIS